MPILAPGIITSYDVPENARDISPMFYGLTLPETVLFNRLGVGTRAINKTLNWYDDELMPTSTTLDAAYTAASGTMILADANFFPAGTIIRCEGSVYRVTDVNLSTKEITIAILSADANHASGKTVEIIGNGQLEGKAFGNTASVKRVERTNYCQIFEQTAEVSGTEGATQLVNGTTGKMSEEIAKKMEYLYRLMGRAIWNGVALSASDNTTPRLMGGVKAFIDANGYAPSSASFNQTNFDAFLDEISQRGGSLIDIWCSPTVARKFSALKDDSVVAERTDGTVGRWTRSYLSGNGATLTVNSDPACLDTDAIYVFPTSSIVLRPLRPLQMQPIAKVGDSERVLLVGEYSLEVRNSQAMGKFSISG